VEDVGHGGVTLERRFPESLEDETSTTLSFQCRFVVEGGKVNTIECDAPLKRYTMDRPGRRSLARGAREGAHARAGAVRFVRAGHEVSRGGGRRQRGGVDRDPALFADDERGLCLPRPVAREPW